MPPVESSPHLMTPGISVPAWPIVHRCAIGVGVGVLALPAPQALKHEQTTRPTAPLQARDDGSDTSLQRSSLFAEARLYQLPRQHARHRPRHQSMSSTRLTQGCSTRSRKRARPFMLRLAEDLFRVTLLDDPPVGDESDAIRDGAREAHLVRHHHHRAPFFGELAHDLQHLAHQLRVERRGWLIEEQRLWIHRQRARNGDTLLLAAGELLGYESAFSARPTFASSLPRGLLGLRFGRLGAPGSGPA